MLGPSFRAVRTALPLLAAFFGTIAMPVTPVVAQEGTTTGSIAGRVLDADGMPLANAIVRVTEVDRGTTREVLTDENGRYVVALLLPGRYTVRAELAPRPPADRGPLTLSVGQRITLELTLAPIAVAEIFVVGEQIDLSEGGVVELVDEEQIDNLPTLGRDFTDFINLSGLVSPTPEVTTGGQFSLGGGRTSATNVQIDGVDANNTFFGENRGSSRIPFTFSLESIKEFQIITNGFDVEYGNFTGGIINAVTKGGTNEFHGSAFGYFRDEALTRDGFDGQPPEAFRAWQYGARLSGPIVRDKAHFFVSLDGQQKNQPVEAMVAARWGGEADSLARFVDILQRVYGVSAEEIANTIGTFDETEDELALFGRLDWQLSDNHSLTLRHNYADFDQQNDRVGNEEALTHGATFEDRSNSFVAELNSLLGGSAYNTFRFQWAYEDRPRNGNNLLPEVDVTADRNATDLEYFGDGIVFRNRLEERKFQIVDNLTWTLGDHTLKFGTNNVFTNIKNLFWLLGNGIFSFRSLDDFENMRVDNYFRLLRADAEPPFADFDISEYAFYVQDEWRMSDRFLLTVGLRYDWDVFNDPAVEAPEVVSAFGRSATEVPSDRDNLSPRVAFTYDVKGDGSSVVRGGAGLLYGRMPLVLHGNVMQTSPPLLSLFCGSSSAPAPDYDFFRQSAEGLNNPTTCVGGGAAGGRPEFSLWEEGFENPQSWKFNLGYEQVLENGWQFSVDGLYGTTSSNFNVLNLNQKGCDPMTGECTPVFNTAVDNRPVFVNPGDFNRFDPSSSRIIENSDFQSVYLNRSDAESRALSLTGKIGKAWESLRLNASYTFNHIKDNSSFFCCTSNEGFRTKEVAGSPIFIGDPGDEINGTWGHADFERRHIWILSGNWRGPAGIRVAGIWRSQSGTPWTMGVSGDVNGDGEPFNDRAPIFSDLQFEDATEAAQWQTLLSQGSAAVLDPDEGAVGSAGDCLVGELGQIARRNTCRNPWFHSVDLHIAWEVTSLFGLPGSHQVEIIADLFNVLNLLSDDWGKFEAVIGGERAPLRKEGYDANTNKVIYSVNDRFGQVSTLGFNPLQFQAQLGLRYRF